MIVLCPTVSFLLSSEQCERGEVWGEEGGFNGCRGQSLEQTDYVGVDIAPSPLPPSLQRNVLSCQHASHTPSTRYLPPQSTIKKGTKCPFPDTYRTCLPREVLARRNPFPKTNNLKIRQRPLKSL